MKTLTWIATALCAAAPLAAQEQSAELAAERTHVVRKGDTLWGLARTHLHNPLLWPEIFRLNSDVVSDPARIYPNNRLRIPMLGSAAVPSNDQSDPLVEWQPTVFSREPPGGSLFGESHTVVIVDRAEDPVVAPGEFFRAGFVALDGEVAPLGSVVGRHAPDAVAVGLTGQIQVHERIHVALQGPGSVRAGDSLHLVRPGRGMRGRGRIFQPTGIARVEAVEGMIVTAVIDRVYGMVTVGNLAFPLPAFPVQAGVTPVADAGPRGTVLAFQDANVLQMTQEIAFLDLGHASGVREGDEFSVYLPREQRQWGEQPEVEVARLRVVRVDERTSAARVVALHHPVLRSGLPVRRIARMP